jgi:hypothetical protein
MAAGREDEYPLGPHEVEARRIGLVYLALAGLTVRCEAAVPAAFAGAAHSVTVTALDAYGNVATGYRGTVHFTSSDTKAGLPADYTFTGADAGVHVFPKTVSPALTLKTAGSQWVRATDKVTATITGVQSGIVVS